MTIQCKPSVHHNGHRDIHIYHSSVHLVCIHKYKKRTRRLVGISSTLHQKLIIQHMILWTITRLKLQYINLFVHCCNFAYWNNLWHLNLHHQQALFNIFSSCLYTRRRKVKMEILSETVGSCDRNLSKTGEPRWKPIKQFHTALYEHECKNMYWHLGYYSQIRTKHRNFFFISRMWSNINNLVERINVNNLVEILGVSTLWGVEGTRVVLKLCLALHW